MSFRNRSVISGANGPINLSIPLLGGRDQKAIAKEVKIDNSERWQILQMRSIISGYNRSPFFEHYRDGLGELFSQKYEHLFSWNLACIEWLNIQVGVKMNIGFTEKFEFTVSDPGTLDLRNWFFPRSVDEAVPHPLTYRQVFEDKIGFVPNLSILDLLFCSGPAAIRNAIQPGRLT